MRLEIGIVFITMCTIVGLMSAVDHPVRSALRNFANEELDGSWSGKREREAVSLFSFGALIEEVTSDGPLTDTRQIGLEVPVPQVTLPDEDGEGKKSQVCKDVVIWPDPRMTCWDSQNNPTVPPIAILEWKFDRSSIFESDVRWLEAFTEEYPNTVGYAVTANQPPSRFKLSCTRVSATQRQPEWLHIH